MKVYEVLNNLKDTDCTPETIADWLYDNRICPCCLDAEMLYVDKYPKFLNNAAEEVCKEREMRCDPKCCLAFAYKDIVRHVWVDAQKAWESEHQSDLEKLACWKEMCNAK